MTLRDSRVVITTASVWRSADFNAAHQMRKISPIYGLKYLLPAPYAHQMWVEQFFLAHIFDHTDYGHFDGLAPLHDLSLAEG